MMKRSAKLAAIFGGMAALIVGGVALAAAPQPLFQQSDAPPTFGTLHTKTYTSWVSKMKVTAKTVGVGKGTSSCDVFKQFKADGWIGGVIQSFDGPSILSAFELCEHVFATTAGAQKAYAWALADLNKNARKAKGMKTIPVGTIGDASKGVYAKQNGIVSAEMLFRHGPYLVAVIYLGSQAYSGPNFVDAVQRANSRIQ